MTTIRNFLMDESGFAGAEKALLTVVGLGLILALAKTAKHGNSQANHTIGSKIDKLLK